jgi:hypothetical protein
MAARSRLKYDRKVDVTNVPKRHYVKKCVSWKVKETVGTKHYENFSLYSWDYVCNKMYRRDICIHFFM